MKIRKSSAYEFLLMVLFLLFDRTFGSYVFSMNPIVAVIYSRSSEMCAVLVILVWLYYTLRTIRECRSYLLGGLLYILLFFALLLLLTFWKHGSVYTVGMSAYPVIAICMLTSLACRTEARMKHFFHAVSNLFFVFALINFILLPVSSRLFPEHHYFMGIENQLGYSLNIGLLFCLLDDYYNHSRIKYKVYLVVYCITIFIVFSASNVVGAVIVLSFLYVGPLKYMLKKSRFSVLLISYTALFLVVLLFSDSFLTWDPVQYVIKNVLGKDTTLTNRTIVWGIVLAEIATSPVFGHGMQSTGELFYVSIELLGRTSHAMLSAHNQILQTLYEGGAVSLAVVILFLFSTGKHLKKMKDDELAAIFKIFLLATLVMLMAEAPGWNVLFYITDLLIVMSQLPFCRGDLSMMQGKNK